MRIEAMLLLAAAPHFGCSSSAPFRGKEYEEARSSPVQQFTVQVKVEQQFDDPETLGAFEPSILRAEMKDSIEEAVVKALEEYRTFVKPYRGDPPGLRPDLKLTLDIRAPANRGIGPDRPNNYIWADLFLWLAAGFPAWLFEDVEVSPEVRVRYRVHRTFDPASGAAGELEIIPDQSIDLRSEQRLNFIRRAGAWQYVQQVIIPPFLVKSNPMVADKSLFEGFVEAIQKEIGAKIKTGVREAQLKADVPLPYLQVAPLEGSRNALLFLFSDRNIDRSGCTLEVPGLNAAQSQRLEFFSINEDEGKQLLEPEKVKAMLRSGDLARAYQLYKDGKYSQAFVGETSALNLAAEPATSGVPKVLVKFTGDDHSWSWTPPLTRILAASN